jgi:hypothetical protein
MTPQKGKTPQDVDLAGFFMGILVGDTSFELVTPAV